MVKESEFIPQTAEGVYPEPVEGRMPQESPLTSEGILSHERTVSLEGKKIRVDFIYIIHTPEYVAGIAEAAREAGLVAIEFLGANEQTRQYIQTALNAITHSKDENAIDAAIKLLRLLQTNPVVIDIINEWRGTNKEIVLVDLSEEEGEIFGLNAEEDYIELQKRAYQESPQDLINALPQILKTLAKIDELRELTVLNQVRELAGGIKIWGARRMAVIQGATHTPTSHMLQKEGAYETRTKFVPKLRSQAIPRNLALVFTHLGEGIRRVRFERASVFSEEFLEKIALEIYLGSTVARLRIFAHEKLYLARRLVEDLGDQERKNLLLDIGREIKKFSKEALEVVDILSKIRVDLGEKPMEQDEKSSLINDFVLDKIGLWLGDFLTQRFSRPLPGSTEDWESFIKLLEERSRRKNETRDT